MWLLPNKIKQRSDEKKVKYLPLCHQILGAIKKKDLWVTSILRINLVKEKDIK